MQKTIFMKCGSLFYGFLPAMALIGGSLFFVEDATAAAQIQNKGGAQPVSVAAVKDDAAGLDTEAMKKGLIRRLNLMRGGNDSIPEFDEKQYELLGVQKVIVRGIPFYAVKVRIQTPEGPNRPGGPQIMNFVTDKSGSLQFDGIADIGSGTEVVFSQADKINRLDDLPAEWGKESIKGTGAREVIMISDPYCGYCRIGYAWFDGNKDKFASLRIIPYELSIGSAAALWFSEYVGEMFPEKLPEVMAYLYKKLPQINVPKGTDMNNPQVHLQANLMVLETLMKEFPDVTKATPQVFLDQLQEKYAERQRDINNRLNRQSIASTPVFIIDGVVHRGFNEMSMPFLLSSDKERKQILGN